ncbi:type VII secretion protein EccCa [Rhodococcus sp. WS4]|nr:type VII secretion protein EccCa [Rhodococcus sp. WS4]
MVQKTFRSRPPHKPTFNNEAVTPQNPLDQPDNSKAPILQRIIPFVMILTMVGMVVMMITMNGDGGFNPMFLMAPMMLLMALAGMLGGIGGGGQGDLASSRKNYFLHLREERKKVHIQGKLMFDAQAMSYPQPRRLAQLVGVDVPDAPSMWTIRQSDQGGWVTKDGSAGEKAYRPYLAPRVGLGTVLLDPEIITEELSVSEHLEPVTLGAYRRFVRTQRFVAGFPIGYQLGHRPFHSIAGPDEHVLPLVRAMIASLAFNHAPDQIRFILITDSPESADWSLMKWLPHVQDPGRPTTAGAWRTIYTSMRACAEDLSDDFARRGPVSFSARKDTPTPHMVVIVDLPADEVRLPEGISTQGVAGVTFLVVRAKTNRLPSSEDAVLHIDSHGKLSTAQETNMAKADALSLPEFERFVRTMAAYRPPADGEINDAPVSTSGPQALGYLQALGIDDLESFDPRPRWDANEMDQHLTMPLGNVIDESTGEPTGELLEIDFSESSIGGTGPNGVLQGKTGSGKSFILRPVVMSLATRYGPDRLNFILMDFKGGATFIGFERLPHVLANITNLASEAELLDRARDVIEGEILRRTELITKVAKVETILEYRELRATKRPDLPLLPSLFIVADEFREFMMAHREYMALFERIAQVGRALGMHLLAGSQFIDSSIIGAMQQNLTFGISLKVDQASYSNTVIKSDAATRLPIGDGSAYLWRDVGEPTLTRFRGFNLKEPHLPAITAGTSALTGTSGHDVAQSGGTSSIELFTATNAPMDPIDIDFDLDDLPDAPIVSEDDDETVTVRDALFDRLAQFQEVQPKQLWLPTLKAPITFAGIEPPKFNQPDLQFHIGDLDDPRNHRRVPYVIVPEGQGANVRVLGARGSGRSTTVETIIASAALSHSPSRVGFYIIDCGTKLQEVKDYPNVGAYARRTDTELVDRILGEFVRILNNRSEEFGKRGVASYQAYEASKVENPVESDPYGHMFLVIDDIQMFLAEDETGERLGKLLIIGQAGGSLGIHLLVAGGPEMTKYRLDPMFGLYIHHYVADLSQSSVQTAQDTKAVLKTIPSNQPGRVVELTTGLHGRILVPQAEPIDPVAGSTPARTEYDQKVEYGAGIRELGAQLAAAHGEARAHPIVTVPALLTLDLVWNQLYMPSRGENERALPLGASAEDLTLVTLPDSTKSNVSPHLVITGDRESGKTTVIRSLLYSIVSHYRPDQAQIYLLDPDYKLINERDVLDQYNLLAGYAADKAGATKLMTSVDDLIKERVPKNPETLTARMIRDRSWYSGPEIFVIVDPVTQLMGTSSFSNDGAVDVLNDIIGQRTDLGLHVFATTPSTGFTMTKERAFFKSLYTTNPYTLLLSGTGTDTVFGSASMGNAVKFARRRPGLGQLYNATADHYPVVQTAWMPEWANPHENHDA